MGCLDFPLGETPPSPFLPTVTPHLIESPSFFPTVTASRPPPAVSGGTLLVTRGGLAIAADPDLDLLFIIDLQTFVRRAVVLEAGDEPGRLAEDAAGRVHVALRSGGALVTIDPATATILTRRSVCPAPRGVAYEAQRDLLHVACAGGELVSLPAAGGAPVRTVQLDRDLRDVIVQGDRLFVSRFRSAELLSLSATGAVTVRHRPLALSSSLLRNGDRFAPAVAWRTVLAPDGTIVMLHQRGVQTVVATTQAISGPAPEPPPPPILGGGGRDSDYGGAAPGVGVGETVPCTSAIVHAALSTFTITAPNVSIPPGASDPGSAIPGAVLAVDVAFRGDGGKLAVASAGNSRLTSFPSVVELDAVGTGGCAAARNVGFAPAQVVAVAYDLGGRLVVQTRSPAMLWQPADDAHGENALLLSSAATEDTGHTIFHSNSGLGIACASCHPEGGDDGRVWAFDFGARRTQALRGGILATAPFHWNGDQKDIPALVHEVFVGRMGGPALDPRQVATLSGWLDKIPALPNGAAADAPAALRGRALFESPEVACASCHSGARFTNNQTLDVGTGGAFQVPSLLGVAARAPYLHDGCAATLHDRFGACGGSQHGGTAQLSSSQIDDLVAYLETL